MDNQKSGYIPLYRSVLKQPWAKDVYLRTLWENLLLNAARQPYTAFFKGREWPLQPGQLVVTAADLGLQLCDRKGNHLSRDAVERMLAVFVREGMISIEGEKQKGRVISITNYTEYAQKMDILPAQTTAHDGAHGAAHDEASNGACLKVVAAHDGAHEAAQTTAHHEQEGNNKNIKTSTSENSDESSDKAIRKVVVRPEAGIKNGSKWGTPEDLRCAEWLFTEVQAIAPSAKKPNLATWANDIRLMRERDSRSHHEICALFRWACQDSFWQGNVLCPATLREKWDRLNIQRSKQQVGSATGKPAIDFNNTDWIHGVL